MLLIQPIWDLLASSPYEFGYVEGRNNYSNDEFGYTPQEEGNYLRRRRRPVKGPWVSNIQ